MAVAIALPMIRRAVSPIPIGRTPGHLSRAISRQEMRADSPLGSTRLVLIRLAVAASASHKSVDAVLKDVQSRLQARASRPEALQLLQF